MSVVSNTFDELDLLSTIGFQGKIQNGLHSHPDREHIIYCVGQNIIIRNLSTMKQYCLSGHSNSITCLSMAKDGSMIASGQVNFMGFKADVIVWDFLTRQRVGSHNIHRVKVEAVEFSCNGDFVVSVGGEDCRNVIIWDVKTGEPLCGAPSAMFIGSYATKVRCGYLNNNIFMTAGSNSLRLWKIDRANRKVIPTNISLGSVKREILCMEIDYEDEFVYCGTSSGDVLKVKLNLPNQTLVSGGPQPKLVQLLVRQMKRSVPEDVPLYALGITAISIFRGGGFIIGTGEGMICRADEKDVPVRSKYQMKASDNKTLQSLIAQTEKRFVEICRCQVMGSVTSISIRGDGHQIYIGTSTCEIYRLSIPEFLCELLFTCHGSPINDIVFPDKCSDLFATCALESIRIWNLSTSQELLRITVPNMTCYSIFFAPDGQSLVSGWDDGKIRAHAPESGHLLYVIHDAHQRGVTALGLTSDSSRIVSGGGEGEVRVWDVNPSVQMLLGLMKEHKGAVTSIRLKSNDEECVTSGADGSCIVWNIRTLLRIQVVFANTLFRGVCYALKECQILTCGTDRMIGFWEILDGTQIRDLEGSQSGAVNAIDISCDSESFVSGGADKLLKVWNYREGVVTHVGLGHSDEVTALRIPQNRRFIVSVSKDGAILIWRYPF